MKLYHSTSKQHLLGITHHGQISNGDVPTSPGGGFNAVWFSDREIPKEGTENTWFKGSAVDKTEVIIEVEIDRYDPRLQKWSDVAVDHEIDPKWLAALNKINKNNDQDSWWIYYTAVEVEKWTAVKIRNNKGVFVTFDPAQFSSVVLAILS